MSHPKSQLTFGFSPGLWVVLNLRDSGQAWSCSGEGRSRSQKGSRGASAWQGTPGAGIGGISRRRGSWELWDEPVRWWKGLFTSSVPAELCPLLGAFGSCCSSVSGGISLDISLDIPSTFPRAFPGYFLGHSLCTSLDIPSAFP